MTETVFIADLHLSPEQPVLTELLLQHLDRWQGRIDALYILGDCFDAWIGDDDRNPFTDEIAERLARFTAHTPVYFVHGNRDFLLGSEFAHRSGLTLLPEHSLISLYGRNYVIAHGDELCTDDLPYMQFRAQSRHPLWQQSVLAKPLTERRLLAAQIRQMSEMGKAANGKSEISDATEAGIAALMQNYPPADLIHGHTHRPGIHSHTLPDGRRFTRYVLQDWYGREGGCLTVSPDGVWAESLQPLS